MLWVQEVPGSIPGRRPAICARGIFEFLGCSFCLSFAWKQYTENISNASTPNTTLQVLQSSRENTSLSFCSVITRQAVVSGFGFRICGIERSYPAIETKSAHNVVITTASSYTIQQRNHATSLKIGSSVPFYECFCGLGKTAPQMAKENVKFDFCDSQRKEEKNH